MPASSATARSVRSGRFICRPMPKACGRASRSLGRICSAWIRANWANSTSAWTPPSKDIPTSRSGIDIACWDILGQAAGLPVCALLGGRYGERRSALSGHLARIARGDGRQGGRLSGRGLTPLSAQSRRRSGHGHRPHPCRGDRCSSPATGSWPTPTPAGRSTRPCAWCRAVRDVDVYIEQPCLTYEECLAVRRHTDHPFVLDENIDSLDMLLRGQGRPGDGRGESEDQQARRPDEDPAGPRSVRVAWASP